MAGDRSYRNLINRREHRERGQPTKRRRLGLLEKHKDYALRAKDFHRKERTIVNLKRKAEERNPDEFYFGMVHGKTERGVHKEPGTKAFTEEELALLRSQDLRYVTMRVSAERAAVARLQATLQNVSQPASGVRTVFVDTREQVEAYHPAQQPATDARVQYKTKSTRQKSAMHDSSDPNPPRHRRQYVSLRTRGSLTAGQLGARPPSSQALTQEDRQIAQQAALLPRGNANMVGEGSDEDSELDSLDGPSFEQDWEQKSGGEQTEAQRLQRITVRQYRILAARKQRLASLESVEHQLRQQQLLAKHKERKQGIGSNKQKQIVQRKK